MDVPLEERLGNTGKGGHGWIQSAGNNQQGDELPSWMWITKNRQSIENEKTRDYFTTEF